MLQARSFLGSDKPAVWLFVGDSITQGALHTFGLRDYTRSWPSGCDLNSAGCATSS